MKHHIVLLGIAASVVAPLLAHADPESVRSALPSTPAKVKTQHMQSSRVVYYVTDRTATGSHLPIIVRHYRGRYDDMSSISTYGRPDLDRTGQLSVAGELLERDPAISSAFGAGNRR